jgi:hypothetical protein
MLILPSNLTLLVPLANAGVGNNNHLGLGGTQPISKGSITPSTQDGVHSAHSGSDIPKNMIAGSICWNWH